MIKSIVVMALATSLLVGCGTFEVNTDADKMLIANDEAKLGRFGVDLSARNEAIKPGDDFFMYASGTWYDNYVMPADKTRFGAFTALAESSQQQVKDIIDDIASRSNLSADEQLISNFYQAYMDTNSINKLGIQPIQPTLDQIKAIKTTKQLTEVFGEAWLSGTKSPIGGYMWFNRLDPNQYEMSVGAGGLGLPDRSYYLEQNSRFEKNT
jgi:putative endopeptidase